MPESKPRCDLGNDWAFGLFIASTIAGGLTLLAISAALAAWVEAGGNDLNSQSDYYKYVGFWLSVGGNIIAMVMSTISACVLGWRSRRPRGKKQLRGAERKVLPSSGRLHVATSGGDAPPTTVSKSSREAKSKVYMNSRLRIIVVGASGDLAKKKTYPSLLELMEGGYLPEETQIWGFARSNLGREGLHERLEPFLLKTAPADTVKRFLEMCYYHQGMSYDDVASWKALSESLESNGDSDAPSEDNRMFYFAIPPSAFGPAGSAIKASGIMVHDNDSNRFSRFVIEKPFGRDSESSAELAKELTGLFREQQLYRIDHYLGKDMVQNILSLRCSNAVFGDNVVWNRSQIKCVIISWKEAIGTQGRGGYFDGYGIIRDVMQNHLLQVLSVVAMEAPSDVNSASSVRDCKVELLNCIEPLTLEDVVLGQYTRGINAVTGEVEPGYLEDDTVPKNSTSPTFAQAVFTINNERWKGVPFIMKAGKALDGKKCEVRVQFKAPTKTRFDGESVAPNELVMRIQPDPSIYLKMNIKEPGLGSRLLQTEMDLTYDDRRHRSRMGKAVIPGAYTRLLLDVLRGEQSCFVRSDELEAAWKIFTPLLHRIEAENIAPELYKAGSRGPAVAEERMNAIYTRVEGYVWEDADNGES